MKSTENNSSATLPTLLLCAAYVFSTPPQALVGALHLNHFELILKKAICGFHH